MGTKKNETREFDRTDRPIEHSNHDLMGIGDYIDGLSEFIGQCATPMTIAIQGGWGSGKTSFMNLIREKLEDENNRASKIESAYCAWFNTWQFSQFNMGDSLPITFLSALLNSLDVGDAKLKENIKKLLNMTLCVGGGLLNTLTGFNLKEYADAAMESAATDDVIKIITELKSRFQDCVKTVLEKKGKERLVIFIDDLDRLPPQRAIELLEILKLFLDCEKCIFVLAVDYDVVCLGIKQKYGEDIGLKKGRSFFDKIIQVPFKMPIANYNVESYIEKALDEMGFSTGKTKAYVALVEKSIGNNPRGMKRLFNALLLLKMVYKKAKLDDAQTQVMMFAVLCLQLSYEDAYNYIFEGLDNRSIAEETFNEFAKSAKDDAEQDDELFDQVPEDEKDEFREFMIAFVKSICNNAGKVTQAEVDKLYNVMSISGLTSSNASVQNNGKSGHGVRYSNTYDAEYSYHSLGEDIENAPNGWNGCKLKGYRWFGKEYTAKTFTQLVLDVLSELYKRNVAKFVDVHEHNGDYGLAGLFEKNKKTNTFSAPRQIPGTEISIETKNSYNGKVVFLRKMLDATGCKADDLELNVQLAHRVEQGE